MCQSKNHSQEFRCILYDLNILLEQSSFRQKMKFLNAKYKAVGFDDPYTLFTHANLGHSFISLVKTLQTICVRILHWTYRVLTLSAAATWPFCMALSPSVDWQTSIYIAVLSLFFPPLNSPVASTDRVLNLTMTLWLPLFSGALEDFKLDLGLGPVLTFACLARMQLWLFYCLLVFLLTRLFLNWHSRNYRENVGQPSNRFNANPPECQRLRAWAKWKWKCTCNRYYQVGNCSDWISKWWVAFQRNAHASCFTLDITISYLTVVQTCDWSSATDVRFKLYVPVTSPNVIDIYDHCRLILVQLNRLLLLKLLNNYKLCSSQTSDIGHLRAWWLW